MVHAFLLGCQVGQHRHVQLFNVQLCMHNVSIYAGFNDVSGTNCLHNVLFFRCWSLDGDADRLVYFIVPSTSSSRIELVDGDKILSLFAVFIKEQLSILNKKRDVNVNDDYQCCLGIVQTAYANGASTDYLKQLGLEVIFTPTGVKYLHEKAAQYDIGIYFEANGHGTILFSEQFLHWLEAKIAELSDVAKG